MASLIESAANPASTADFKAATMDTAERLTSLLYGGYGDDGIANPQQSSLIALDDELWRELYLLPTPPLSPDNPPASPTTNGVSAAMSTHSVANDIAPGTNSGLFVDMMGYDQMMDVLEEAERVLSDSQQASKAAVLHQEHLLLQDCMWGHGGNYDSMLLGSSTSSNSVPANTSTPLTASIPMTPMDDDTPLCTGDTTADTPPLVMDNPGRSHDSHDQDEPDCVEPSAVFPVLRTSSTDSTRSKASAPSSSSRSQTSMSSSESEEEIDVVTVERSSSIDQLSCVDKPSGNSNSNGRQSSKKVSSRHNGSSSVNTTIRKKRHTKRISRRSSEDGAESDEEARRASHNVLERKRRNDLKNSFDILRGGIPELEENLRAPKVVILRKAVEYIHGLQSTEQRTKIEYTKEQSRHKKLMERLSMLRNGFCPI